MLLIERKVCVDNTQRAQIAIIDFHLGARCATLIGRFDHIEYAILIDFVFKLISRRTLHIVIEFRLLALGNTNQGHIHLTTDIHSIECTELYGRGCIGNRCRNLSCIDHRLIS